MGVAEGELTIPEKIGVSGLVDVERRIEVPELDGVGEKARSGRSPALFRLPSFEAAGFWRTRPSSS